jgi:RNA polymerase sigma-70 factor (ECF subfamily)
MNNVPEEQFIIQFKKGDQQAFKQLYNQFFTVLCYFTKSLVNSTEGEEIAADTFIKLFNRHENFDANTNIKAFLYITARKACLNRLKQNDRHNRNKRELAYLQNDGDNEHVLSQMIHAELLREIKKEIEQLTPACRKVFELMYLEGLKARQVAERLNISVNTVWVHRANALEILRTILLKKGLLSWWLFCCLLLQKGRL